VSREATAGELNAWADVSERFAERLEDVEPGSVLWGYSTHGFMGVLGVMEATGLVAATAELDDRLEATVTFGKGHEGPRGYAHGGAVAAAYDDLFGMLSMFGQPPVVTAELRVRYLRPTPLGEVIHLEARVTRIQGRRIEVAGRALLGGDVCSEAEATFVLTRPAP
jgi:uncharacterized protein (TIGR00369 family)